MIRLMGSMHRQDFRVAPSASRSSTGKRASEYRRIEYQHAIKQYQYPFADQYQHLLPNSTKALTIMAFHPTSGELRPREGRRCKCQFDEPTAGAWRKTQKDLGRLKQLVNKD